MKWIMLANSNDCRIYEYDRHDKHLALIEEISHPEHLLKGSVYWTTDGPGHYKAMGQRRGAFEEVDPVEQSIDEFARDIARRLDKGRNKHAYEDVTIIMPARMEGLVLKHMNKHTKEFIKMIVQKNVVFMSDHELALYVEKLFSKSRNIH
jgi:protein required for attachment to host cells